MQAENALHHSRAVGTPRSDATPLVVRPLKKRERRSDDRVCRRRKSFATTREVHAAAGDAMAVADNCAERKVESRAAAIANTATHRELTFIVPRPPRCLDVLG